MRLAEFRVPFDASGFDLVAELYNGNKIGNVRMMMSELREYSVSQADFDLNLRVKRETKITGLQDFRNYSRGLGV
jgi:hypothetical protein